MALGSGPVVVGKNGVAVEVKVDGFKVVGGPERFPGATLLEHAFETLLFQGREVHFDQLQNLPNSKRFLLLYSQALINQRVLGLLVLLPDDEQRVAFEQDAVLGHYFASILGYLLDVVLVLVQKLDESLVLVLAQLLHPLVNGEDQLHRNLPKNPDVLDQLEEPATAQPALGPAPVNHVVLPLVLMLQRLRSLDLLLLHAAQELRIPHDQLQRLLPRCHQLRQLLVTVLPQLQLSDL